MKVRSSVILALSLAVSVIAGCSPELNTVACTTSRDCQGGQLCSNGTCVVSGPGEGDTGGSGDVGPGEDAQTTVDLGGGEDIVITPDVVVVDDSSSEDEPNVSDPWADFPTGEGDPAPDFDDEGTYRCEAVADVQLGEVVNDRVFARIHGFADDNADSASWYLRTESGAEVSGTLYINSRGDFDAVLPVQCGRNLVKLVWEDDACDVVQTYRIEVETPCTTPDIRVALAWRTHADLDLHLIRPDGLLNNRDDDCNSLNCVGGGLVWGDDDTASNPVKTQDETDTGIELINLGIAGEGTYAVMVENGELPDANGPPIPALIIGAVGGDPFAIAIDSVDPSYVWHALDLGWPGAATTVDQTYNCVEEWGPSGCERVLPER